MYNLRKRPGMAKSGEALKGSHQKKYSDDGAVVDCPKAKEFSSLPRHLQELVLLKTSTQTRLKLFQVNRQLREWVFKEGLFSSDVERIETAYRAPRPDDKIVTYDRLKIFKILTRSGLADIVEIDVTKAKKWMAFKNVRSCRNLVVTECSEDDFRVADFFPNLRFLGTFDIKTFDEISFEVLFERTSLEVTLALSVPWGFLEAYHEGKLDEEKLFEWIDKYASRCPSINFADISFKGTVKFLKTRKLRFIEYCNSIFSTEEDRGVVEMILKNGIPGEHPDPCIKIGVRSGFMIHMMSILAMNDTLVVGDLERILKKFMDHSEEVGWHFDKSVVGSNAVGFTIRFDESRNMIFLLFENKKDVVKLLIKYEPIEK